MIRDLKKKLKEAGFVFEKRGGRHPFYTNGRSRIMLPTGNKVSPNTYKWVLVQIKRAQEVTNPGRKSLVRSEGQIVQT